MSTTWSDLSNFVCLGLTLVQALRPECVAAQSSDARRSLDELYRDFDDYLMHYEKATDKLIAEGYLLAGFKRDYMNIAAQNAALFDE